MSECCSCQTPLDEAILFCDLGSAPLANSLLTTAQLSEPEVHYPLKAVTCPKCSLVQLEHVPQGMFGANYPFYSGQAKGWVEHCERFAEDMFSAGYVREGSRVLEIGSNDGTMLRPFQRRGAAALGIEPSRAVAEKALREGLATSITPWDKELAQGMAVTHRADLVIADNVLAHVSDLNSFLWGVRVILADGGVAVFEVPDLANMVKHKQWDQIYHEHHCYFSASSLVWAVINVFLDPFKIESVDTHGGSLRLFALRRDTRHWQRAPKDLQRYSQFAGEPPVAKVKILTGLFALRDKVVVGYGASAKAATLLNYCGIKRDLIGFIADTTPAKQGMHLPGSHIPIVPPKFLASLKPDVVVNFIWNWREEAEGNIRALCPEAKIITLTPAGQFLGEDDE